MNSDKFPGPVVSVRWLSEHLDQRNVVILDASMKPVVAFNSGAEAGAEVQIPGTRIFDFDKTICDKTTSLPHMMPTASDFEREVRALGINNGDLIVAYDRTGVYSSPRAWWMWKAMGHDQVAVLDGGLRAWLEAGLPVEPRGMKPVAPGTFVAQPRNELFTDAKQVMAALHDPGYAVLDARSEGRFYGREPEPRAGLRGGHMPRSQSLPFQDVQTQGRLRSVEELRSIFDARVRGEQKLIFSCGSGVTSCILALAAELAGYQQLAVYDGSWSEWGMPDSGLPVSTAPERA